MEARSSFPAQLQELPRIFLWMEEVLMQLYCDSPFMRKLELAVEEAVVNIIRHSKSEQIEIGICGEAEKHLEISILDKGPPFNPLIDALPADRSSPLEKRKEGGLGIFLMKQVVDEVHYRREGDANVLTFKKSLSFHKK